MEEIAFLVIGCGPAGAQAAREAAARGIETVVLEKDAVVGTKRVCAAGLRPGFCETFDLPRSIVHCDTPRMALFDDGGRCHAFAVHPAHTTTREELDGTMAQAARDAGAQVRTQALFRSMQAEADSTVVEYADLKTGQRRSIRACNVFFATGATARLEGDRRFGFARWTDGLLTCYQHRVYLEHPVEAHVYETLELHYYRAADGRQIIGWMFPKRDHLTVGLGVMGKMPGAAVRAELDRFTAGIAGRLYPHTAFAVKEEGHLLYGGPPRPNVAAGGIMVGGTAAGLVDATNGEGIFEAAMSGRFAAGAVCASRTSPHQAAVRYGRALQERFYARLNHRVTLMRFLERKPRRFGILFEQLASTPRFVELLQPEHGRRSFTDRLYLYVQAAKFAANAVRA
ncbi:MAG: NAD(P)/FAD-dependent oxidoreductase [Candidatus Eremiobacteraeota bacterium]|nr:NAD(P)/FAD-dependent oxidoreductase [Candidatus Eremiobacteraeota bacterium]